MPAERHQSAHNLSEALLHGLKFTDQESFGFSTTKAKSTRAAWQNSTETQCMGNRASRLPRSRAAALPNTPLQTALVQLGFSSLQVKGCGVFKPPGITADLLVNFRQACMTRLAEKTIPHRQRGKLSQESHLLRLKDWERNFRGKPFCT